MLSQERKAAAREREAMVTWGPEARDSIQEQLDNDSVEVTLPRRSAGAALYALEQALAQVQNTPKPIRYKSPPNHLPKGQRT